MSRYARHLPWIVKREHADHEAPKMLRLLARRDQNLPLTDEQDRRLTEWLEELRRRHEVVAYSQAVGFYFVTGEPGPDGVPVVGGML